MKFRNYKAVITAIQKAPTKRLTDYWRSPQWKITRNNHLRMYPTCEICKLHPAMQVHHVTYRRLGFEHPLDLVSVCVRCHHEIHIAVSAPLTAANDNEPRLPLVGGSVASGY